MKSFAARLVTTIGYLWIVLICSGCASVALSASALNPIVDEAPGATIGIGMERAEDIALNALEAWNAGDYVGWSRDWSAPLKANVSPDNFEVFHNRYFNRYGACFAVTDRESRPSPRIGYTRWSFDVACRSGQLRFIFAFADGNELVESVYVEPLD